jgi:hypothetical protein
MRDIETIDSELRLVAALREVARERGGPLPSIDVADALLDERRELTGLPRLTRCLVNYYVEIPRGTMTRAPASGGSSSTLMPWRKRHTPSAAI